MPFVLMAFWMSYRYFRHCSRPRFGSHRTSTSSTHMIQLADNHMIVSSYSGSWSGGGVNSVKDDDD